MVRRGRRSGKGRKPRSKWARKGRKTVNVNRALQPIPQRYICQMKYGEVVSSSLGGGTYGLSTFNLNSIFDPNRTGTGHQPYGHDTFQTLYNRYRVISCTYRINAYSSDGSNIQLAVIPTNETITPGSISEVRENPRCKYTLQSANAPLRIVSGKVHIPSLVGRTKAQYMADDRYQAQFGASPSELALLNLYVGPATENSSMMTVYYNVELKYTVECFDVKHLAQS